MSNLPYFYVRPYGANETRAQLPADTIDAALHLKRIFGGAIVCAHTEAEAVAGLACAGVDWSPYSKRAAALADLAAATDAPARDAAHQALRRGELERDIALGFTDLWSAAEREAAQAFGLI